MTSTCLIITDNKIGNINPAFALAEEIQKYHNFKIEHIIVKPNFFYKLLPIIFLTRVMSKKLFEIVFRIKFNPNCILTIGNGGNSVPYTACMKAIYQKNNHKCLFVQLQNPRISPLYYDYVVAPTHDFVRGSNVIPTIGSLTKIKTILNEDIDIPLELMKLRKPIIGVFIGGSNGRYEFNENNAEQMANFLMSYSITNHISLAITCSRRTTTKCEMILRKILYGKNIYFPEINSDTDNPYYAILKISESIIVTADSINMISEAVTAHKPVLIYPLKGDPGKFNYFYSSLKRRKLIYELSSLYKKYFTSEFDETSRVGKIISESIKKRILDNKNSE